MVLIRFMLRCRDEARTLERSLRSLASLQVPHEIHVFLHKCTDGSEEIARECQLEQPITIRHYSVETARAGYETAITPAKHIHSLVAFYNWCHRRILMRGGGWIFKWDADFIASRPLIDFLNGLDQMPWASTDAAVRLSASGNAELYLSNCLESYGKHVFWEVPNFKPGYKMIDRSDIVFEHAHRNEHPIKSHWFREPWFKDDAEFAPLYNRMIEICGPEPIGCARASNRACNPVYMNVVQHQAQLADAGIELFDHPYKSKS